MGIFKKIAHLFKKEEKMGPDQMKSEDSSGKTPDAQGACPVCWGYQEYDHKIRQKYKDKQIDVKNHKNTYLKAKRFLVTYIDGQRYKKAEVTECPRCGKGIADKTPSDPDSKN